ncbi:MAG: hypothetical protein JNM79_13655 [Burkholderiales bacterium]|nr:hypothetical protein [Burkholderiales bacterium]
MDKQAQLHEFEALVAKVASPKAAFRTSIQAHDLDDATDRLAEMYGRERVLSVWNENDASKPWSSELQQRGQHEL